jgi:glycine cleavage system regulatory protein
MNVQILITITGAEQADLVKALSAKTDQLGGKWLTSKISHVDGYIAGLIKVELDPEKIVTLLSDFNALSVNIDWVELKPLSNEKRNHFNLSIDTKDRAGLVKDILQVLSEYNVKVESMECNRIGLPNIDGILFTSHFKISTYESFDENLLTDALQTISEEVFVDIKKR